MSVEQTRHSLKHEARVLSRIACATDNDHSLPAALRQTIYVELNEAVGRIAQAAARLADHETGRRMELERVRLTQRCTCGHERVWHDLFDSTGECIGLMERGTDVACPCRGFELDA